MYAICSFYKFSELEESQLEEAKLRLEALAEQLHILGLLIIAKEGVNGTVASTADAVESFKALLIELFGDGQWPFKESSSKKTPFKRFKVKIRSEIVTTGLQDSPKVFEQKNALTPQEWHEMLQKNEDVCLIDTRNYYETELGMFKGAVDPALVHFKDFGDYVRNSGIPKDKTVLMYCTGGIRCEKAIFQMQDLGYSSVFQLQGGILNYLKEFPDKLFEGECFVFDHRVAVTQQLEPSERWSLCPHCGQPGDVEVHCIRCEKTAKLCERCTVDCQRSTCSKDCENQLQRLTAQASK